jgi:hypothetical protein
MSSQPGNFVLSTEDKFDGSNWAEWKETIMSAAKSRGVMGYLEGTIQRPATPPISSDPTLIPLPTTPTVFWGSKIPTQDEWEQRNAYAQGLIALNVKNPIGHGIKLDGTAAESWKSLTDVQDKVTDIGRLAAGNALRSIRHTDGADIDAHFCSLRKAWKRYNDQGGKMDDTEFRMIILASMPKEWVVYISTLGAYPTSAEVIAQIMAHDSMLARDRPSQGTPGVVKALATTPNRSQLTCSNCKRTGHTHDKCFRPGGGMEGQYPEWWKKKGNPTSGSSNTQTPKPTANVTTVDTTVGSSNSDGEYYALVTEVNSVPNTTQPHAQVVTFADSACSDHCFVNRSDFTSYRPVKDKDGDTVYSMAE